MVTEIQLFESSDSVRFLCVRLETKVDTEDEFLGRILNAVGRLKKREVQLKRTTRDLCTRVAEFMED
jgi:hypothetical protein